MNQDLSKIYTASQDSDPGSFEKRPITVFKNGEPIGSYERNYGFLKTFYPFECNGRHLALYSPHYTCTRILDLETCTDIGGEKPNSFGFCPVDFYVPRAVRHAWIKRMAEDPEHNGYYRADNDNVFSLYQDKIVEIDSHYLPIGFVSGCTWGDDSSWKLEYLDLSKADEGIISRYDRYGYISLSDSLELKNSVGVSVHYKTGEHLSTSITSVREFDESEEKYYDEV